MSEYDPFPQSSSSLMERSDTNFLDFADDASEITYNYFPFVLAELIYTAPVTGNIPDDSITIHPFKTVYEESFVTSAGELMFTR